MIERSPLINRSIDDVARAMTSAAAPALRARVVARLPNRRRSGQSWLMPAVATAAVAVACVALLTRRPAAPAPVSTQARVAERPLVSPVNTNGAQPARAVQPRGVDASRKAQPSAEGQAWQERAVAVLPAIDDITITAIQPATLSIAQLNVKPIAEASPLTVAPLDGNNRQR